MEPTSKDRVLASLERNKGAFVSGGQLAAQMGITRNSVWKAVEALRRDGYAVESVTGKGYRLSPTSSVLSAASIKRYLDDALVVEYHDSIDSTNLRAKILAATGAPEVMLIVANEQTAGRGRQGRSFSSPAGTGVYFSLLLRPRFAPNEVTLITSYAACCVAGAIDACTGLSSQIKWVNDIFVDRRKVCGILTEASIDAESRELSHAVVGIGINVMQPKGGFADGAASVAGALTDYPADRNDLRARLVAESVNRFMRHYEKIPLKPHLEDYRKRSLLAGKSVRIESGDEVFNARVIGIDDDFCLRVQLEDGTLRSLASGSVHIPSSQLS